MFSRSSSQPGTGARAGSSAGVCSAPLLSSSEDENQPAGFSDSAVLQAPSSAARTTNPAAKNGALFNPPYRLQSTPGNDRRSASHDTVGAGRDQTGPFRGCIPGAESTPCRRGLEGSRGIAVEKIDEDAFRRRFERHLSWVLSAGKGGERGDFSGLDLDGANLHGYTLHGATFAGASLRRAELRRAELRDADLAGADLGGAFLHDAVLTNACLRGARLARAELVRADLAGADLSDADLAGADLLHAVLDGADLDGADLTTVLSLKPGQLAKARLTPRTRLPEGLTDLLA